MAPSRETKHKDAVVEQALRHINHHGGSLDKWYVGIEEKASNRDDIGTMHPASFELISDDEAKTTMSALLDLGLQVDDEYGTEPTILFVYTFKKKNK